MSAQKGKTFILKLGNGATTEVFTTVGGMRATSITINNTSVDITDKDSDSWQTLLADAGGRNITISASGIFKDTASETSIRTAAMAATLNNYQILFTGTSDKFQGAFQIENFSYQGDNNDVVQYSMSLKSSGEIVFTAGP